MKTYTLPGEAESELYYHIDKSVPAYVYVSNNAGLRLFLRDRGATILARFRRHNSMGVTFTKDQLDTHVNMTYGWSNICWARDEDEARLIFVLRESK